MSKRRFGELENTILRVLASGKRMTVKEVHAALGEENNYNTIMTVMYRLSKKGILARERLGVQFEYWLITSTKNVPTFFETLKQKIIGIKTPELISYLIETNQEITDEEFDEVERLIKKAKEEKKKRNAS